jgi:hypothetical protein
LHFNIESIKSARETSSLTARQPTARQGAKAWMMEPILGTIMTMVFFVPLCGKNKGVFFMPDPEALGKIKKGGNCFIVYDADIRTQHSKFIMELDEHGYKCAMGYGGLGNYIADGRTVINMMASWVFVNIDTQYYAIGRQGLGLGTAIGGHAITVDEFHVIDNIFQKYKGKTLFEF